MNEFERACFAMLEAINFWRQRFGAMVKLLHDVTGICRQSRGLQAGWLFVLADVKAASDCDLRDLLINRDDIRHVTSADRLNDQIESRTRKHCEIVHRSFNELERQVTLSCNFPIDLQHFWTDIDDRNVGSQ